MTKPYLSVLKGIFAPVSLLKKIPLIIVLLAVISTASAQQQKPGYTLLWKISGKGMAKPSFLFGTMHVKDKRVFGFSDSVMLAIKSCPSFALEIHPDTLIKQMFDTMGDSDSTSSLRKMLSKEEYEELAKRFEAKNGYPLGDINPAQAESMMQAVKDKPDDRKAFVDAFLYGVARGMDKNIYGLENSAEHFNDYDGNEKVKARLQNILEADEQEEIEQTEDMIDIYSTGNLQKITDYLRDELQDSVMITRNNVMANSIIKHMATQPIFSAVGVAHLPGEDGVINLLKNAGYTVTPVTANFTGVADKFNTDYTNLKWTTYTDEPQGYSIDFPFNPVKTSPTYGVNAVVYPDMANDIFLGTYAVLQGVKTKAGADLAIANVVTNLKSKSSRILSNKVIMVNGVKATEIIVQNEKHNIVRYRFLLNNNFLYCIYAGNDMPYITQPYVNRFFNSFKTFKPTIKPDKKWITYQNDTAALSLELPIKPLAVTQKLPSPQKSGKTFNINLYLATDSAKLINYLMRYNDYPSGMYLADKVKAFETIGTELESKGAVIKKTSKIFHDGYEGREVDFTVKDFNCRAQLFVRGNRVYLLLKQNLNGGDINEGYDFFKTLKFKPFMKAPLQPYEGKDGMYRVKTFKEYIVLPSDSASYYDSFLQTKETVYTTNPFTGGVFGYERAGISKYYRAANPDSIYKTLADKLIKYTDTLLKTDTIKVNGINGREYLTQNTQTKAKQRYRLFINNADMISFTSHAAEEDLFSDASNEFYSSLTELHKTSPIPLSTSKAKLITDDLLSTDTTTYKYALGAVSYYKFEKDELPYLLSAVQKNYADDTTRHGAREALIKAITELKDAGSVETLVKVHNTTTSNNVKASILSSITDIDRKKGYDIYLDLLTKQPTSLGKEASYRIFSPMYDSIEYVAANYTRILPLIKYPEYRRSVLAISDRLFDQDYKDKNLPLVKEHFSDLTHYANDDLNNYLKDTTNNSWGYGIYSYLQLMNHVKGQPLTETFTSALIKNDKRGGELSDAVITRIYNNLSVSPQLMNRMLDSTDLQYDILKVLDKNGKLTSVPLKYRTQQSLSKASLYKYIADEDDGNIEKASLLGTLTEKGMLYYVYKYTTEYNTDTPSVAICGPYKPGSGTLNFIGYRVYSDGEAKKTNWQLQAKKMIPALLEQNKSELKNNN